MLQGIEQLDKRLELAIWRFVYRGGRVWVRRLLLVSIMSVAFYMVPGVLLMSWLMPGDVLGVEQMILIAMMIVGVPAFVLYGGLFTARAYGLMGRRRSFLLAATYTFAFFSLLYSATAAIGFSSQSVRFGYAAILTSFTAATATLYSYRSRNFPTPDSGSSSNGDNKSSG